MISMAGFVSASLSRRSPMLNMVMYFPSFPASGESFTEARTEITGGSMALHGMLGTFECDTKVCVHFGWKPVMLTETMSPATALLIGSRVTPWTTEISFTLPDSRTSPSKLLARILSPLPMWPLKILPVTVGPNPGNRSTCETNIEKPPHFSSTAKTAGSTTPGLGGGTTSLIASKSANMWVGLSSERASSKVRAQKPTLPEAYNVG
mmetsp:Transcript_16893/g.48323  ORF Transcript_16893/g.48323 Transcript_16893/m.48323 type:complete len:207 (-) Transcript_16893:571-1191(-)